MVSILPSGRGPFDVLGQDVGRALQGVLPQAVQQGYQRGQGLSAIDQLQKDLSSAGGDINKMLPAIARAYTLNPNLERSGIAEHALRQAKTSAAYGQPGIQQLQPVKQPSEITQQRPQIETQTQENIPRGTFATPGPFNVMTNEDIDAEATRFALNLGDPNAYQMRVNQLTNQNNIATTQREALEDAALKAHVSPSELPRFMVVNSHLDPRNPSQWAQEGIRNFNRIKANDKKIQNAFIPGTGSALIGRDRDQALKRLIPTLQENKEKGLEQEDRAYLADNYLTPTEIETLYHPLTEKHNKAIKNLPKGIFPSRTGEELSYFAKPNISPFISYEEALEKDPKGIQVMQDRLTDFFLNNVDDNTSLLGLREKVWKDRDYDWRQIGLALREAQKKGLKLNPEQEREATIIDSQAPIQSLPDLFQDLYRIPEFLRGNR